MFPVGIISNFEPLLTDEEAKQRAAWVNNQINPETKAEKFYTGDFDIPLSEEEVKHNFCKGMQGYIGSAQWVSQAARYYSFEGGSTFDLPSSRGGQFPQILVLVLLGDIDNHRKNIALVYPERVAPAEIVARKLPDFNLIWTYPAQKIPFVVKQSVAAP